MSEAAPHSAVATISACAVPDAPGLLEASGTSLRETIQTADLERDSKEGLVPVLAYLQGEFGKVGLIAQKAADAYWSVIKEARTTEDKKNQCMVGTRVRFMGASSTLAAEWYRNRFSMTKGGNTRVYSEYIRKGQGHRYSMTAFKGEPYWARQVIEMVENRYAILRKRAEILGKVKRLLIEYEELLEKT